MTRKPRRVRPWPWLAAAAILALGQVTAGDSERRLVNDHCPVMEDEPASPLHEVQFRGVAVRFCCSDCKETFAEDPGPYLSRLPQLPQSVAHGAASDVQLHDQAELAASSIDRWFGIAFFMLAMLVASFLVLRIVRHLRLAHAAGDGYAHFDPDEARPATGPRGPE